MKIFQSQFGTKKIGPENKYDIAKIIKKNKSNLPFVSSRVDPFQYCNKKIKNIIRIITSQNLFLLCANNELLSKIKLTSRYVILKKNKIKIKITNLRNISYMTGIISIDVFG